MEKAINCKDLLEKLNQGNMTIPEKFPFPCPINGCNVLIYDDMSFLNHLFHDGGHNMPLNEAQKIVEAYHPLKAKLEKGDA